jgi:tetratricopeptide (TPR) repeat protein
MNLCPPAADLERLLTDELPAPDAGRLRAHLAACPACQERLDELSEHPGLRSWRGAAAAAPPTDPRLGGLLAALRAAPVVSHTPTTPAPAGSATDAGLGPPRADGELGALGPYRLLAEVGRGGLGVVYKAYDEALGRVVAVKVLRHADAAACRRFAREARAAAAVRSDFVVPVHAVSGPEAAGPYLVMEYVAGPTLRQRLAAEGRLDPREAARLAAQAADGLAAAHALGLVHRDVKPANVLHDRATDRARLADFGLAREAAGGTTGEGTILGTPEYMSPEQVRSPGQVDARSDVYSLGATLYELLTGDAPFRGTAPMVVQRLLHEEPVPPRRLNEAVPRDLETVCLKALAKEPGRRYQTAAAFRDDLRRWLNGEPIEARPVGRVGRLALWCRRRPVVAGLTAGLLVVFAVGLGGVLWQWAEARANWREAVAQRERAEDNLRDALDAVEQLHTRVSEERLLNEPGMQPLRKELLETARGFYVRLIDRRRDAPAARADLARALHRLSTVSHVLGDSSAALAQAREALDLQRALVAERPDDAARRRDLAGTLHGLGVLYGALGRPDDAEAAYEEGRALARALAEAGPDDVRARELQYRCTCNLGVLHLQQKRLDKAEEADGEALELARRLADAQPDVAEWQRLVGRGHNNLAVLYFTRGQADRAGASLKRALPLLEKADRMRPGVADYQYELARTAYNVASLDFRTAAPSLPPDRAAPRLAEAAAAFRQAIDAMRRLAEASPGVTDYRHTLGRFCNELGLLYQVTGRLDEAEAAHLEARRLFERLAQDHPAVADFAFGEAVSWQNLGDVRRDAGNAAAALTCFDRAGDSLDGLLHRAPEHAAARAQRAALEADRATALFQLGRPADAAAACDRAVEADQGGARHLLGFTSALLRARLPGHDSTAFPREDYAAAVREGEAIAAAVPLPGGSLYLLACVGSLASAAARQDESIPPPERERRAEQYAARAVARLVKARAAGYFRPAGRAEQLDDAPELAPLRGRDDFRALRQALAGR